MNLQDGSENFWIISSRSQLKSDWSIRNAVINRLLFRSQFGTSRFQSNIRGVILLINLSDTPLVTLTSFIQMFVQ